ncbi:MAG TPA: ABC transporter permease [Streptosporangiaceae bacterium]|nr:ABC transporter permease [Streptosporangiaceae bacterium]
MSTEVQGPPPETTAEAEAAAAESARLAAPEIIAGSLGEYARIWLRRVRAGESGALPVTIGLVAIVVYFQVRNSLFLSAGNLVNLLIQGTPFILLGMAEVFVLLLGEIDLSVGYNAAMGAMWTAWLAYNVPWWVAVLTGLAFTAAFGMLQGAFITLLGLPSFVVTLGGFLGLEGLLQVLVPKSGHGAGGTIPISSTIVNDLTSGNLTPAAGWIVMAAIVVAAGGLLVVRDRRRRASGLVTPPISVTALKVLVMAAAGVVVVLISDTNRGVGFVTLSGLPWAVLVVLGMLALWTALLGRTRFGRYVYAIGGNAEAARRAGVNLVRIRTLAFTLCGLTAGVAGVMYASRLGSISTNVDGGQLVLFAVASAVIGGTHLFGGRGRMLHALLGGLVVATIYNGLFLLGLSAAATDIVTAIVLLAAVTVDALARRGATGTS